MNYLLDTNLIVIYAQKPSMANRIEREIELFDAQNNLFISVVSVGEVEFLMMQRRYGEKKKKDFRRLLNSLAILDINIREVIAQYAQIDAFSQGKLISNKKFSARNMGKNDLWIAATASAFNLTLVTTDKDFNHLSESYLALKYITLNSVK